MIENYWVNSANAHGESSEHILNTRCHTAVSFPNASIVVQTYGDFLNFNPHLHAIVADGCFFDDNSFRVAPAMVGKDLEKAFQYEVLKMLKKEGNVNDTIIENLLSCPPGPTDLAG